MGLLAAPSIPLQPLRGCFWGDSCQSAKYYLMFFILLLIFALSSPLKAKEPFNQSQPGVAKTLYKNNCSRCHDKGIMGAPKLNDRADWQERLSLRGVEGLRSSLYKGFKRMPKKGGCFNCTANELDSLLDFVLQPN